MTDLNNAAAIRALDTLKMIDLTQAYPRQFEEGYAIGMKAELPQMPVRIDNVVIFGTGGGSAASANLLRSYLFDRCSVPIISVQGYSAPGYVGKNTLCFAVSHSGKTEEILSSTSQALAKGATVIGLGAGGKLMKLIQDAGLTYIEVPGGFMPRIAIGYIMMPILTVLRRVGLVPDFKAEFDDAVKLMGELATEYAPETPVAQNRAKQLAEAIGPHIPVIYGFTDHYDAVAWRIKNQLGENSKYMAFWNTIPHLHHDEAVGWDMQPELAKTLGFLLLRDDTMESEQMKKRWSATTEIVSERMGACETVWAKGQGRLARMLSLVTLGDFFTIYMAIRKDVDPTPVAIIDLFKAKVGQ
jgi:glucose/mannose-6-phosphate isomerase